LFLDHLGDVFEESHLDKILAGKGDAIWSLPCCFFLAICREFSGSVD
jgi:hypothetical protein